MRRPGVAALLLAGGCLTKLPTVDDPCGVWPDPGLYTYKTDVGGNKRKAYVYVPATEGPRDVVVAMHGGGSNARAFSDHSQFIRLADRDNFVAVFPQAKAFLLKRGWNAGGCCGPLSEDVRSAEDVRFLDQLTEELRDAVCGDRVLATGFSNGAMMAHRWACEGDAPDALVAASGQLAREVTCTGDPLPMRHYHGTSDSVVPEDGLPNIWSVDETLAVWRERNLCTDEPPSTTTQGPMTCDAWDCAAPTERCIIEGWDHRWPGGANSGALGSGIDATDDALDFLYESVPTGAETSPP